MQNTHSHDVWVQLQITKYCITTISAQLLLGKHRHSKKSTGTKSQQVTSQRYYLQSKDIERILIVCFFSRSTCRHKIQNDTNLSCQNNRGKIGKLQNSSIFLTRRERNLRKFTKIRQNTDHRHEAKLPIQISHLLAQVQVFRKSLDFRAFRIIFTILTALCHELNR